MSDPAQFTANDRSAIVTALASIGIALHKIADTTGISENPEVRKDLMKQLDDIAESIETLLGPVNDEDKDG